MSLRQENQDLQTKLKSLSQFCDKWEKQVEVALRQKDIENRLIKTELAKANLLKNEEKEKFLSEKHELLQILSMMQEQQHRIEGQEAKLRNDLSNYASKYDECQAVISSGMNRFQSESKIMLQQIEKSKQDYKVLLSKYLGEKQHWNKTMNLANKKVEMLEKLCRALKDRQDNNKSGVQNSTKDKNVAKREHNVDQDKTKHDTKSNSEISQISLTVNEDDGKPPNETIVGQLKEETSIDLQDSSNSKRESKVNDGTCTPDETNKTEDIEVLSKLGETTSISNESVSVDDGTHL